MLKLILPSFSIFPSVTPIYTYGRFYQSFLSNYLIQDYEILCTLSGRQSVLCN